MSGRAAARGEHTQMAVVVGISEPGARQRDPMILVDVDPPHRFDHGAESMALGRHSGASADAPAVALFEPEQPGLRSFWG